ncbi:MAG: lipase family protein [Okeania sp. SIO3B3]|nr:lipase family protein [Okeania sp. SIO3B3]
MATTYKTLQTEPAEPKAEPAAPKAPPTQYTWEQIMFSHIWIIYCISFPDAYIGSKEYLQKLSTESVREILADPKVKRLMGSWDLVWGLAIFQFPDSGVNDNTLYIAKYNDNNPEKDTYVLSVAGTNMKSLYSILFEDCDLLSIKEWNNGKPWESPPSFEGSSEPSISSGFTKGLNTVFNKTKDSNGTLVIEALEKITSSSTKPIDLFVVGHSLAGTLAPLMSLSLFERQSEWNSSGTATLKGVYSLAGPTPGNLAFQEYYTSKIGDITQRLWCSLDIVPNGAKKEGMEAMAGLYEPDIPSTPLVEALCLGFNKTIERYNYQGVTPQEAYSGTVNNDFRLENINKYPEVKEFLADQCAGMVLYVFLTTLQDVSDELEKIPLVGEVFAPLESELQSIIKSATFIVSKFFAEVIDEGVTANLIDRKIESVFEDVLDHIGIPIPISLVMSALPDGLISGDNIYHLMDWYMQFYYQHVDQYVAYYGVQELYDIKGKITSQVDARLGKEENKKQKANTIVMNYGKAKEDDIEDLFNGEGKLLAKISDTVAELKQSGKIEKTAQPLVVVVEKQKNVPGLCF